MEVKDKSNRIVTLSSLASHLKRNERVVFTHGTFDLFHIGHLSLFESSKRIGSVLIVGVDHDENVPLYKRKKCPVFNYEYRIELISRVRCVDYVIPLCKIREGDGLDYHYLKLYAHVRPDVVTHGHNFSFSNQVEEHCKAVGADHKVLTHAYSHVSTSGYINEIIEGGLTKYGKNV